MPEKFKKSSVSIKILGVIPARAGSKRLPGKNKLPFDGKPLIQHIILAASRSKLLTDIVVNTDDEDILSMAASFENVHFIKRPPQYATDDAPAIGYVQHTLAQLESNEIHYDIVVILQPTSPLTLSEDIDKTIELLLSSEADSSVSVVKLDHAIHPIKLKTMDGAVLHPFFEGENGRMAEKDLPEIYVRNCSVYVSRRKVIDQGKIIGEVCLGYIMPRERSIDINDITDFAFAEFLKKKLDGNSD